MTPTKQALEAEIRAAFPDAAPPPADQLIQRVYADSDDAHELRAALAGKRWTEVPIRDLFRHREMVIALGGAGYRAYVPAYLAAALTDDEKYGADLRHYLLFGLRPLSEDAVHVQTAEERLSRLDARQRTAIASVLRYLADVWHMKEADEILRDWRTA